MVRLVQARHRPAAEAAGCSAFLSLQSDAPVSIAREILKHLLDDAVAVFDLGALEARGLANPNVMYELGIRHAFQLPSVIVGSPGTPIPFDVADQRAVIVEHTLGGVDDAGARLANAIGHALAGDFFNPLEGLAQARVIDHAATTDEAMKAIGYELKELRRLVEATFSSQQQPEELPDSVAAGVARMMRDRAQAMKTYFEEKERGRL